MAERRPLLVHEPYAFFWKQWPSNWERSPFVLNEQRYVCVEQFMMAEKARLFKDEETLGLIMASDNPAEHKDLGRLVKGYDHRTWCDVRRDVVFQGTIAKYQQNPELYALLVATDPLVLVEACPEDRIWGIGVSVKDPNLLDTTQWGSNLLGKTITSVRELLMFGGPRP